VAVKRRLLTNSLKYAFDGRGGTIAVGVEVLERGGLRVRIRDNGKGLPSEPRAAKPGSGAGMKLIDALARQIGAKPVWSSSQGGATLCLETQRRS
jgi:two-component sensor histidine kinase